jgi:DNA mismatch repair protein MutH
LSEPLIVLPPRDEAELMGRAWALAGQRLGDVAAGRGEPVPSDLRRNKGWMGELLERVLGASAGSRSEPDFPTLDIELKTLPVTAAAVPLQTTYVCTAPLDGSLARRWPDAWACRKLSRVLWVPLVGASGGPPGDRCIGAPMLWSPNAEEYAQLEQDYEEISDAIHGGQLDRLDARLGVYMHLRPKAASSRDTVPFLNAEGQWVETGPRGLYLRKTFTASLLAREFG